MVVALSFVNWAKRRVLISSPNAHIELSDELVTHPGVDLPSPILYPSWDPERDKAVKKLRRDKLRIISDSRDRSLKCVIIYIVLHL